MGRGSGAKQNSLGQMGNCMLAKGRWRPAEVAGNGEVLKKCKKDKKVSVEGGKSKKKKKKKKGDAAAQDFREYVSGLVICLTEKAYNPNLNTT